MVKWAYGYYNYKGDMSWELAILNLIVSIRQ